MLVFRKIGISAEFREKIGQSAEKTMVEQTLGLLHTVERDRNPWLE
jgi:hypothetical protein